MKLFLTTKFIWKTSCLIFITIAFCTANIYSQKKSGKAKPPVFSSVYLNTNNGKSCRIVDEEIFRCKPVGGYRIFMGFHNVLENVWIETVGGTEVARIPSNEAGMFTRSFPKFEWRLANGKPFAVIVRFAIFTPEDMENNRDLTNNYSKFPQILVVKGLPGFEQIDFELDTKTTPNSNQKARDLADTGYRQIK